MIGVTSARTHWIGQIYFVPMAVEDCEIFGILCIKTQEEPNLHPKIIHESSQLCFNPRCHLFINRSSQQPLQPNPKCCCTCICFYFCVCCRDRI